MGNTKPKPLFQEQIGIRKTKKRDMWTHSMESILTKWSWRPLLVKKKKVKWILLSNFETPERMKDKSIDYVCVAKN